jgi:hypothetical protein
MDAAGNRRKAQAALDLAQEIEDATIPVPKDLMLVGNERALICEALRLLAAQLAAPQRA